MTPRENDLLRFIERSQTQRHGVSPSLAEMADALGLRSKSGAHRLLISLERQGRITRERYRSRSIIVRTSIPDLDQFTTEELLTRLTLVRAELARRARAQAQFETAVSRA